MIIVSVSHNKNSFNHSIKTPTSSASFQWPGPAAFIRGFLVLSIVINNSKHTIPWILARKMWPWIESCLLRLPDLINLGISYYRRNLFWATATATVTLPVYHHSFATSCSILQSTGSLAGIIEENYN